ncbi:2-oxoglutarate dehydrogenase E1 component [Desulfofustis glycolicus]|uniref:oxoglutarate dehydrogenase (succinyl-transferring) n=1 Tax=Desulfofustis glycolicus DSM 9705 TaxID=1121409 RepID=A0A1M5XQ58_9BACT|nr:2-oxoglutarate dehydrogenase E1 component [Desulfofustis glycolicus]MCB2217890.1 2-oxoglutarate dehydrogenase E1 component [Desulfobulbaceae bacterium]SHI01951.1 2-oxoglutarate dehydrogenase E1 component [Desulfofustis glycolicus DSM 9705]
MKVASPTIHSIDYIEEIWQRYQQDPYGVSASWREYFDKLGQARSSVQATPLPPIALGKKQLSQGFGPGGKLCAGCGRAEAMSFLQYNVSLLVRNYRVRGHLLAKVSPLRRPPRSFPELEPEYYGMSEEDFDLLFNFGHISGQQAKPLRSIIEILKKTYTECIGVQFMHIDALVEREWLQERMESSRNTLVLAKKQQVRILEQLTDAVVFEQFIQKKFVGAKSFSLEGAETLIPLLDQAIDKAVAQGVDTIVIGMPHRGRLNVLANIMGKHPHTIFGEFKDADAELNIGRGDVKYHKGYHREWRTDEGNKITLDLSFNPSHLEFVGPVAQGALKARHIKRGDDTAQRGLLILIHGDAAIAGEGIVQETLNLSGLSGFSVGGTLHVVVNNEIGFTTLPEEGRSTVYASDVAKMLQSPIFHVNGEVPDAVAQCLDVALDFRQKFKRDVVLDMYCYRRRGHNEGDEPRFTQPTMYQLIDKRPTVMTRYTEHLVSLGELTADEAEKIRRSREQFLEEEYGKLVTDQESDADHGCLFMPTTGSYRGGADAEVPEALTGVDSETLVRLGRALTTLPAGFTVHPKLGKLLEARRQMCTEHGQLDWGAAEGLALASLVDQQVAVRLCGQDSQRGTFSHRHSVLHDSENGDSYTPLAAISPSQGRIDIVNSPLTEGAVLGFEYGYSTAFPESLVVWEAQFGDFANAAQVYIDQFIASAETKWNLLSGLVLLLPHGLEGTGSEHASARLERFLALAATDNYQVVYPTEPSQIFHLLRRQVLRKIRKPLIVMSPKSLLRHPRSVSSLSALTTGSFRKIIADEGVAQEAVQRILLCTGKVYYDLLQGRQERELTNVAIIRIEQLYPLPEETLLSALRPYPKGIPLIWVQEEPLNMGAYPFMYLKYGMLLSRYWRFARVGRPESATPATGSAASHKLEQRRLIEEAFTGGGHT